MIAEVNECDVKRRPDLYDRSGEVEIRCAYHLPHQQTIHLDAVPHCWKYFRKARRLIADMLIDSFFASCSICCRSFAGSVITTRSLFVSPVISESS